MRLVDANAYSAEMKDRQEAAWKWRNEAIAEEDEVKLARAEGAYTAFTEAKLTMDKHIINPWHRVEEPPKENGRYLVYMFTSDWRWEFKFASYLHDRWIGTGGGDVRYWMHIEPPKEDA